MKKVLLVSCFERSGGAEVVFNHTKRLLLDSGRYEVDTFIGATSHCLPKSPLEYIWSMEFAKGIKEKLNQFEPDVVHIHGLYHLLSPSILQSIEKYKHQKRLQVIYTAHDYHLINPSSGMLSYTFANIPVMMPEKLGLANILMNRLDFRGWHYSLLKKLQWFLAYKIFNLRRVIDKVLCPSFYMKSLIDINAVGLSTFVVRNPIDVSYDSVIEEKQSCVEGGMLKLVFLGRLSKEKGLANFLMALSEIERSHYLLDIYGDGDEVEDLERLLVKLNLGPNVRIMGYLENSVLRTRLMNYDALVLPSTWYENSPLALVEGALSGLKLMTMNYGGMKETAQLCGNYVLLSPDFSNLEDSMHALMVSDFVDNTLKIKAAFSPERYLEQIESLYR